MDNLSAEEEREWGELISRPVGELLDNPKFWGFYFFTFCDEKKVREFSEACGVPMDYIKAKRGEFLRNHLRQQSPYWHLNNGTIN